MNFLASFFPNLAQEAIEKIANTIFGKPAAEVVEQEITPEQKEQSIAMAAQMQSETNQTMRIEAQSEHWLVRSWRPLTIYGLGLLTMSIVALHEFGGIYFLFQTQEMWERFHDLIEINDRQTNLLMTGFLALCGIYFPLRSAEKGTFSKIKSLLKK